MDSKFNQKILIAAVKNKGPAPVQVSPLKGPCSAVNSATKKGGPDLTAHPFR